MMDWDCFLTGCTTFCGSGDWRGWGGARGENIFWYFLMWLYGIAWTQNVPIAPSYLEIMYKESSKLCFACGFSGEGVHLTYGCSDFENLILFSTTNCKRFFPPTFCLEDQSFLFSFLDSFNSCSCELVCCYSICILGMKNRCLDPLVLGREISLVFEL